MEPYHRTMLCERGFNRCPSMRYLRLTEVWIAIAMHLKLTFVVAFVSVLSAIGGSYASPVQPQDDCLSRSTTSVSKETHHGESTSHHAASPSHYVASSSHHIDSTSHYIESTFHHIESTSHHTPSPYHHTDSTSHHSSPSTTHHTESTTHHTPSPYHHTDSTSVRSSKHHDSSQVSSTKTLHDETTQIQYSHTSHAKPSTASSKSTRSTPSKSHGSHSLVSSVRGPSTSQPPQSSPSKISLVSSTSVASCPSPVVASIVTALTSYVPAYQFCASLYPESSYYSTQAYVQTAVTIGGITTTSIFCATPSSSTAAPTTSSSTISSSATSQSTGLSPEQAYTSLTNFPSDCISSVCASRTGTYTVTLTDTRTAYDVTATEYAKAIEVCNATTEYCDTSNPAAPLCRPLLALNECHTAYSGSQFNPPACTSTNGCPGGCFFYGGQDEDPTYNGVCGGFSDYYAHEGGNASRPCGSHGDCGRGEFCGFYPEQNVFYLNQFQCIVAASECNYSGFSQTGGPDGSL